MRKGLTFTLTNWATVSGVLPARNAASIRRLARVDLIVTRVALRLWILLTSMTLGLECRTDCSVVVKANLVPVRARIRPILGN